MPQRKYSQSDVERWSAEDVVTWLSGVKLGDCADYFSQLGINGERLLKLTPDDIKSMECYHNNDKKRKQMKKALSSLPGNAIKPGGHHQKGKKSRFKSKQSSQQPPPSQQAPPSQQPSSFSTQQGGVMMHEDMLADNGTDDIYDIVDDPIVPPSSVVPPPAGPPPPTYPPQQTEYYGDEGQELYIDPGDEEDEFEDDDEFDSFSSGDESEEYDEPFEEPIKQNFIGQVTQTRARAPSDVNIIAIKAKFFAHGLKDHTGIQTSTSPLGSMLHASSAGPEEVVEEEENGDDDIYDLPPRDPAELGEGEDDDIYDVPPELEELNLSTGIPKPQLSRVPLPSEPKPAAKPEVVGGDEGELGGDEGELYDIPENMAGPKPPAPPPPPDTPPPPITDEIYDTADQDPEPPLRPPKPGGSSYPPPSVPIPVSSLPPKPTQPMSGFSRPLLKKPIGSHISPPPPDDEPPPPPRPPKPGMPGPVPTEPAKPQAPAPADPVAERPRLPTPKDMDKSFFSKPQLRPPIKTLGGPPPRPPSNTKPAPPEPQESSSRWKSPKSSPKLGPKFASTFADRNKNTAAPSASTLPPAAPKIEEDKPQDSPPDIRQFPKPSDMKKSAKVSSPFSSRKVRGFQEDTKLTSAPPKNPAKEVAKEVTKNGNITPTPIQNGTAKSGIMAPAHNQSTTQKSTVVKPPTAPKTAKIQGLMKMFEKKPSGEAKDLAPPPSSVSSLSTPPKPSMTVSPLTGRKFDRKDSVENLTKKYEDRSLSPTEVSRAKSPENKPNLPPRPGGFGSGSRTEFQRKPLEQNVSKPPMIPSRLKETAAPPSKSEWSQAKKAPVVEEKEERSPPKTKPAEPLPEEEKPEPQASTKTFVYRPFSQRKKAGGARSPPQEAEKPKPPIPQEEEEKEPRLPPRPSEPESPPSRFPPRIPGSDQPTEEPPIPERPPFFKRGSRGGGTSQPPAESAPELPGRPPTSRPPPTESALPVRPPPSRPPPMESTPEPPKITGRPPPTHHPGYPPPDTRGPPPPEMRPPPPEMRAPPPPSEQLVPARPPKPAQQITEEQPMPPLPARPWHQAAEPSQPPITRPPPVPTKRDPEPPSAEDPPLPPRPSTQYGSPRGCSWYHSNLDRKRAEIKLKKYSKDGTFIIRDSTKIQGEYSLSLLYGGGIRHLRIRLRQDKKYVLGEMKEDEISFDTVVDLVEYHKAEPLVLKSGGETTLKFECPQ